MEQSQDLLTKKVKKKGKKREIREKMVQMQVE